MRAALQGIVPEQILERRRKAYLLSSPLKQIKLLAPDLMRAIDSSILVESGYIDHSEIELALNKVLSGDETRLWAILLRFASLEAWMRHREKRAHLDNAIEDSVRRASRTGRVPVA